MANKFKVAEVSDFPSEGSKVVTEVEGVEVGVFRLDDGYYAIANYCPHQAGPLCEGDVRGDFTVDSEGGWVLEDEGQHIACPWHFWKFDIKSGVSPNDERFSVPTFDVVVDGDDVFVER